MTNYEIHEFDPVKIFTGEINPLEVNSFKYEAYNTSTAGQLVIDKNSTTDTKRKFISLATKKTSYAKFNQVVDVEFEEFVIKNTGAPIDFLLAKINALDAERETLKSNRDVDREQIDALNRQIEALRAQLEALRAQLNTPAAAIINKIPNILKYGMKLYAGTVDSEGLFMDRLLSKNRKYVAIIQGDRNFVVKKGEFDERGNPLEDAVVELVRVISDNDGKSLYTADRQGIYTLAFTPGGLIVYKNNVSEDTARGLSFSNYNSTAKLILEDSGRLVVTNNSQAVRTWG